MGTYTANYQLYMPSIGEQGWGDLMNGNLTTIDTTMAGLNTRVGTLETETDAVAQRVTTIEEVVSNGGAIKSSSITNSGSITSTGVINANGGIKGNLTGKINVNATLSNTGFVVGSYNVSIAQRNLSTSIPVTYTVTEKYSTFPLNLDTCTYSLNISIGSNTNPSYNFTFVFTVNSVEIHRETVQISGIGGTKSFIVNDIPLNGNLIITCSSSSGSHYIKSTSASGDLYLS